jgi:hypothetical protein
MLLTLVHSKLEPATPWTHQAPHKYHPRLLGFYKHPYPLHFMNVNVQVSIRWDLLIIDTFIISLLHSTATQICMRSSLSMYQENTSMQILSGTQFVILPTVSNHKVKQVNGLKPGLCSRYTKLPTLTPQFLKVRLRLQLWLLREISMCINNGKPKRYFITTT